MSENLKNYHMQGTFVKLIAGEDLNFLDLVEIRPDKKIYILENDSEDNYLMRGQMMESLKKDEIGNVMLNGIIIPKKEKSKYLKLIKRGAMLEIFSAIGETFGFEVRPLEEKAK